MFILKRAESDVSSKESIVPQATVMNYLQATVATSDQSKDKDLFQSLDDDAVVKTTPFGTLKLSVAQESSVPPPNMTADHQSVKDAQVTISAKTAPPLPFVSTKSETSSSFDGAVTYRKQKQD